ncbi:tyrosine-protein phosphatase [Magnetofaba australis]|uniref:protein-tyrosine-phosphatase n=1 Tax=Magnetofaba australis IT-1 TaxID=1434232 RepID=A0A1Y2K8L1_9PROT|nr:CpsB/CapC family capsule biosynthesis tyrosine phosphatase [Magnetofaba australis]OSM05016.1 putative phosphotransferase domain-containing protein [Magnetofaba australis IT-1]
MSDVIDLHCHILPGLDDGARSMDQALNMARMAQADGVTHIVATPHIQPGVFDNDAPRIRHSLSVMQRHLQERGIALQMSAAAEIRLTPSVLPALKKETLPLLNGLSGQARYVLLEFSHKGLVAGDLYWTELIVRAGFIPVLAHPERIRTFRDDPELLEPFMNLGCLTQLTAGSITGAFGARVAETADFILESGWAHVIASDGHGFNQRQPVLRDGVQMAAKVVGQACAEAMVSAAPRAILAGEPVQSVINALREGGDA